MDRKLTHRDILVVAIPIMLSNVTTPLLGAVDMTVIGQLNQTHLLGAIAIGAHIFSMIFWTFGFLRMGTTGFTAQAEGAGQDGEVFAVLVRALLIAFCAGIIFILLQPILKHISFYLMPASDEVEASAKIYFDIRIWSAPATFANYALLGWFIGLGRSDLALYLQLLLNGLNIGLDLLFVMGLGFGVSGVAYATLLAEIIAVLAGIFLVSRKINIKQALILHWDSLFRLTDLKRMLSVNSDIMIRTLCLLFAITFMTAQSAGIDDITLAANAVLLTLFGLSAYFLDGFAYSAERFVGYAFGKKNIDLLKRAVFLSSFWAYIFAFLVSFAFWVFGTEMIEFITPTQEVQETANRYLIWVVLIPVIGVACFQLDGIFIGATATVDMRNMMILSLALYLLSWVLLEPIFDNHGLWGAFLLFFVFRGITLGYRYPVLVKSLQT